jgi:hypothetical protein
MKMAASVMKRWAKSSRHRRSTPWHGRDIAIERMALRARHENIGVPRR